ncbi:hypothetical protein [Candidatus Uabimicrobium amorphum]|uniref:SGNH/GDSL hydrolase family protein n=1 Tax=Uabimicrobium amorphum TaxID=2596890 RepID=A0A5S9ISV8_UABAM|nr:hypothetical protein [Candidatus Uabimicrobium amorphum]BBM87314.1 hypothetical protein UABAM_05723 [Candidatus Uabimicrobium amorphum]
MKQRLFTFNFNNPKVWTLLFVTVVFVGDRIIGEVLKYTVQKSQFRYSRLYGKTAHSKYILIGNSRGLVFHSPTIAQKTKQKVINLSYNSMPTELACALIRDYLEIYPAPKYILWEITMLNYNSKKLIANFTPYQSSQNIGPLVAQKYPKLYWWCNFSHIYRYRGEVFLRVLYYMFKNDQNWVLHQEGNIQQIKKSIAQIESVTFRADNKDLEKIKELALFAKSKNCEIKLMIQPLFPDFVPKVKNLQMWKEKITQRTGLKIYDYSQAQFPENYFVDRVHLNKKGAKAYSQLLYNDGIFK